MAKTKITKEVQFSQARQQLSAIIDEVQKPMRAVTILRRGKPVAVVISHDEFQYLYERANRKKKWKLAGSLKIVPGVDLEKAIQELSDEQAKAWEASMKRSVEEF